MDEALEVLDLLADFGLEGVAAWLVRFVGLFAILAGVGLLVVTEMLLVPAALIVVGLAMVVLPSFVLGLAEFA